MTVVFHHGALGDWVLVFPLLRRLAGDPGAAGLTARVIVVAPYSKAKLAARLIPGVEPLDVQGADFSRLHAREGAEAPLRAADLLAAADQVVSFVAAAGDAWEQNIRALAPQAALALVAPRPPADYPGHVTRWHQEQIERQGIRLPQEPTLPSVRRPRGPVIVHPGSGGRDKCWPPDRFAELIRRLRSSGQSVQPLLGEAEVEWWDPGRLEQWRSELGAAVPQSLDQLASYAAGARAWIGNDSGPTHLAAQMGLPTLALFGPSNPVQWAPVGPAVRILAPDRPRPMAWLSAETVIDEADRLLHDHPCPPGR